MAVRIADRAFEVKQIRIRELNRAPVRVDGQYVLYWMISARRPDYNLALQRAVNWCRELKRPLVVLEALRAGYRWASDRLHAFVIDGMRDNQRTINAHPAAAGNRVHYYPYLEPTPGAGAGLLQTLAERAVVIVTDDFPCFFIPNLLKRAAEIVPVRLEAIDGNGLYPMRATDRVFTTAASFRRHLQKELPPHLTAMPAADPLAGLTDAGALSSASPPLSKLLDRRIARRWPAADLEQSNAELVRALAIDHTVHAGKQTGGARAAHRALKHFIRHKLARYGEERNQPQADIQSHLSPYLHFGHIAAHQIFIQLMKAEAWSPDKLASKASGSRNGWWGVGPAAEAFLDEFVTWREIGYNRCAHQVDFAQFSTLPAWAQQTLHDHAQDPREHLYHEEEFACAATHDPLWNAAQRQLVREGTIHNYLRMLWGKKILEWSPSPQHALETMIELNNKYALDGRNPNSYSGIFWVLGRFDRAWGPERPIFGKVRYMSSANTARKVRVKEYIDMYS